MGFNNIAKSTMCRQNNKNSYSQEFSLKKTLIGCEHPSHHNLCSGVQPSLMNCQKLSRHVRPRPHPGDIRTGKLNLRAYEATLTFIILWPGRESDPAFNIATRPGLQFTSCLASPNSNMHTLSCWNSTAGCSVGVKRPSSLGNLAEYLREGA